MRRKKNSPASGAERLWREHAVRLLRSHEANCLKKARKILATLKSIDASVEIIAREMARQAKGQQ
jgi:hypothetical protein